MNKIIYEAKLKTLRGWFLAKKITFRQYNQTKTKLQYTYLDKIDLEKEVYKLFGNRAENPVKQAKMFDK